MLVVDGMLEVSSLFFFLSSDVGLFHSLGNHELGVSFHFESRLVVLEFPLLIFQNQLHSCLDNVFSNKNLEDRYDFNFEIKQLILFDLGFDIDSLFDGLVLRGGWFVDVVVRLQLAFVIQLVLDVLLQVWGRIIFLIQGCLSVGDIIFVGNMLVAILWLAYSFWLSRKFILLLRLFHLK